MLSMQVMQQLHRQYSSLQEELEASLIKGFEQAVDPSDSACVLRRRALLKLAVDLELSGILPTVAHLQPHIAQLVRRQFLHS
jgi:hypothetical protein